MRGVVPVDEGSGAVPADERSGLGRCKGVVLGEITVFF